MPIAVFRAPASRARAALAALVPLFLAACSGGGGGSGPTPPPAVGSLVYGTAATGAGVAGTVSIEDAAGHVKALAVTGDSGAFSASVDGMTAPFMLKVASSDGATVLYSAVAAPGRANITPLTSLALLRIAASRGLHGPADLYAAPSSFAAWDSSVNLANASAVMLGRLMPAFVAQLPGASTTPQTLPTYDPFGTAWTVGAGVDRLLDAWPVTFSTDATGVVTASQSDRASGLALDVARSDTAATATTNLAITGAGSGSLVGGSSMQLGARATFQGSAQQGVAATWSVTGPAGATIDANGKLSAPAVDTAGAAHVSASWYDGTSAFVAVIDVTILPAMRPTGIDITGAAANAAVAPGASLPLGATVHWSDGSTTTPATTWSWTGDAAAVTQLGSDGLLRAGRPSVDSPIHVVATFSQGGVSVSSDLALTVSRFVRRVQSVSLAGLVEGQTLTAGDHADLVLTALWNDGSESTLAPAWSAGPAPGAANHILTTVSPAGRLTTSSYFVPISADASARAAESDVLQADYDNGDGTSGHLSLAFTVKPLVNVPTGIEIRGATAMAERATASFQVFVNYADGTSSASSDAALTSLDPALLQATSTAGAFTAAAYPDAYQLPAALLTGTLSATRSFAYVDTSGQQATATFSASQRVEVDWVAPTLVALDTQVDHLTVGQPTPVSVVGTITKLGSGTLMGMSGYTFSADSAIVTASGATLTAQAPASVEGTWVTLTTTATNPWTGDVLSARQRITVDLPGTVPKHLLPHDYSPLDPDVQFRAISSDGHVDDYTVQRNDSYALGYASAATRRRLPLFSGVTAFEQSRPNPNLWNGSSQETQYNVAVEQGHVVIIRHADLYLPSADNRLTRPIVLPGVTNATSIAIVARAQDATQTAAVRLYVLDLAGAIRQYALPSSANAPLVPGDAVLERQLPGTWTQISGGADFIEMIASDGSGWVEGEDASNALADPNFQSHWDAPFAMQQGFGCLPICTRYEPLTGLTLVHAGFQHAGVALAGLGPEGWRRTNPYNATLQWFGDSAVYPQPAPAEVAQLANGAYIDTAGVVHYLSATFSQGEDAGGANDLSIPHTSQLLVATWLPPAVEIVDGRRIVAQTRWPDLPFELYVEPAMPIVRAANDQLYYLDGNVLIDPQGHYLVLP